MAFQSIGLSIGRGKTNNYATDSSLGEHSYVSSSDDFVAIETASYFPDSLGAASEEVKVNDILKVRDSSGSFKEYKISSLSPIVLSSVSVANPFDQDLDTTDDTTFNQLTLTSGLLLPTSGGTPTLLAYYEQGTFNVDWTGAFTADQPGLVRFTKIGNMVTMVVDNENAAQDTTGTVFTLAIDAIPVRLRPTNAIHVAIADFSDNGTSVTGECNITSGGRMLLSPTSGSFSGTGTLFWNDFSFSYIIY